MVLKEQVLAMLQKMDSICDDIDTFLNKYMYTFIKALPPEDRQPETITYLKVLYIDGHEEYTYSSSYIYSIENVLNIKAQTTIFNETNDFLNKLKANLTETYEILSHSNELKFFCEVIDYMYMPLAIGKSSLADEYNVVNDEEHYAYQISLASKYFAADYVDCMQEQIKIMNEKERSSPGYCSDPSKLNHPEHGIEVSRIVYDSYEDWIRECALDLSKKEFRGAGLFVRYGNDPKTLREFSASPFSNQVPDTRIMYVQEQKTGITDGINKSKP